MVCCFDGCRGDEAGDNVVMVMVVVVAGKVISTFVWLAACLPLLVVYTCTTFGSCLLAYEHKSQVFHPPHLDPWAYVVYP